MSDASTPTYRRVLVGIDATTRASKAADRAVHVAVAHGGELHIAAVVLVPTGGAVIGPSGAAALSAQVAAGERSADEALLGAQARASTLGLVALTHLLHGDPATALVGLAASVQADLIVVGSRGLDGSGRYVLGSVPEQVLQHAPCDVLVVRTT